MEIVTNKKGIPTKLNLNGKNFKITECTYAQGVLVSVKTSLHSGGLAVPPEIGSKIKEVTDVKPVMLPGEEPNITEITTNGFDIAASMVLDGDTVQITWVKYFINGDLLAVKCSERGTQPAHQKWGGRWLKVPEHLREVDWSEGNAGIIGEVAQIVEAIRFGKELPDHDYDDPAYLPEVPEEWIEEIRQKRAESLRKHLEEIQEKLPWRKELFITGALSSMPPGLDEAGEKALLEARDKFYYDMTILRYISTKSIAPTVNFSGFADYLPRNVPPDQIPALIEKRQIQIAVNIGRDLRMGISGYIRNGSNLPKNLGKEMEEILAWLRRRYKKRERKRRERLALEKAERDAKEKEELAKLSPEERVRFHHQKRMEAQRIATIARREEFNILYGDYKNDFVWSVKDYVPPNGEGPKSPDRPLEDPPAPTNSTSTSP